MTVSRNKMLISVTINGRDSASGRATRNIWWFRQNVPGSAYGDDIADSSMEDGLVAWRTLYRTNILPVLSVNYFVESYVMDRYNGWHTSAPSRQIVLVTPYLLDPTKAEVITNGAHHFAVGEAIVLAGLVTNAAMNGNRVVAQVLGPTSFVINITPAATEGGMGTVTTQGAARVLTKEFTTLLVGDETDDVGEVSGEALPLHATASVLKSTASPGRKHRGGFRFSPLGESQNDNGALTSAALTAWQGGMNAVIGGMDMQEPAGEASRFAYHVVVSMLLATSSASTWTGTDTFAKEITSFSVRPNLGSLVRRKPRLTSLISQA